MVAYEQTKAELQARPRTWLVTGVAGFIGSNLLQTLLGLGQRIVGLDNFATGNAGNLEQVKAAAGADKWGRFRFIEGDITDVEACRKACEGVELVLHQAALGSVPRSMEDPLSTHASNATGFINMLEGARAAGIKRFVYASSSAVYGDDPGLPKAEEKTGNPLSPYAATKAANETYASAFARAYGMETIGLRYFNVFGPRQDPEGAYAAVIPRWFAALLKNQPVFINGDGETSRDFCYVDNVVQSNLLAATTTNAEAVNRVYNVAVGERTTLNELYALLERLVRARKPSLPRQAPVHQPFRPGDVRHSLADISKAQRLLGYAPTHRIGDGLELAMDWYFEHLG